MKINYIAGKKVDWASMRDRETAEKKRCRKQLDHVLMLRDKAEHEGDDGLRHCEELVRLGKILLASAERGEQRYEQWRQADQQAESLARSRIGRSRQRAQGNVKAA